MELSPQNFRCDVLYPLYSDSKLHKCYFFYMCKQISSKVPILLYFVRPKRPSGNYYVTFLCTENPGLNLYLLRSNLISSYWNSVLYHHAWNGSKNVRTWIDCRQQLWLKPSCSIGKLCSLYAVRGRTIGFQFELLDVVFLNTIINGSKAIMKLPWYFYL